MLQDNGLQLPSGWRGLIVPGEGGKIGPRYLAIANLDGQSSQASLHLSLEEGAPVLSVPSFVQGKRATIPLSLEPFDTLGEALAVFAEVQGDAPVEIRRLSPGRYQFRPAAGEKATVKLNFKKDAGPFQVADSTGKIFQELPAPAPGNPVSIEIDREVVVINKKEIDTDTVGPAVEISEVNVREDGRVSLRIDAGDQSGIQDIEVFLDGKPIAKITAEPWVLAGRPGNGYHTFYVIARDGSPRGNKRTSDARTIKVDARGQLN